MSAPTTAPSATRRRRNEPVFRQIFIGRGGSLRDAAQFERTLFLIRKRMENGVLTSGLQQKSYFYVGSLSCNTIVYKGMLSADQIEAYFPDITDPAVESALALVHQRFSTNTFPTWSLAHPFRYLAHNGEINTLRGNINWMRARERLFESDLFGDRIRDLLPVIREGGSDSAMLDNALEMLVMCGRSLPHAVMMLIPEAWNKHESMSPEKKAFYEYHSCLMEPWDGPASISFTDGTVIGAVLDRNGLRPSRYYVTKDNLLILASEVGVLDIPARGHRAEGAAPPRAHAPGGHRPGPDHRRRGAETHHRVGDSPMGSGCGSTRCTSTTCRPPRCTRRTTRRSCSASRPSGTPTRTSGSSWRPWRRAAKSRRIHGERHLPGRPLGSAPHALRLLQAALRPGDEPAPGRHP